MDFNTKRSGHHKGRHLIVLKLIGCTSHFFFFWNTYIHKQKELQNKNNIQRKTQKTDTKKMLKPIA